MTTPKQIELTRMFFAAHSRAALMEVSINSPAAPAGTPRPVIERLNREIIAGLNKPATKARLAELGLDVVGNTPAQATKLVEDEIKRRGAVIKTANIKAD